MTRSTASGTSKEGFSAPGKALPESPARSATVSTNLILKAVGGWSRAARIATIRPNYLNLPKEIRPCAFFAPSLRRPNLPSGSPCFATPFAKASISAKASTDRSELKKATQDSVAKTSGLSARA